MRGTGGGGVKPSKEGTDTGRFGVRGCGSPVDKANSGAPAPTDERRVDLRSAGLDAVEVDILDLIGLEFGNAFGGGPRPRVRCAVCELAREVGVELVVW